MRWLLRILLRVRVEGDLAALQSGRRLVVANHDSLLDGVLLALFLPGLSTVVITAEALRHPLVRIFRRTVCFVVLDRARPLALKALIRRVQKGEIVAIFPQGRVSTTGTVMKVYDSAGVIAARSDAEIVPVHIRGTLHSRLAARGGSAPRRSFPRVVLMVQAPIKIAALPHLPAHERRRALADEMLRIMQRMTFNARCRQTLFGALTDAVALHGRSRKIIEDARQQPETYGALLKMTVALARLTSGVTAEGETVGVMLPNLSTTVALVFGLTATRRVAAMLNYSAGPEAMHAACVAAGIKTVITSRRFIQVARLEASVRALHGTDLVYLEDLRAQLKLADKLWIARALMRPASALPPQDPAAVAIVLFTSG
ncbi:MAG TPA: 1-acyl-sn-glycerol-3-phosphate acyltransferase, partial [Burkholderiales bacterium]